jgi:hypothetical protein
MKLDLFERRRNRIVDIAIRYTGVEEKKFFSPKSKGKTLAVKQVCIWLMYKSNLGYEDISGALNITHQNYYYHINRLKKWKRAGEKPGIFELAEEIMLEVKNEKSELSLY